MPLNRRDAVGRGDGLAIVVGSVLGTKLPEKAIRIGTAALFIATGIYTLVATIWA